jgi:TRAP-type C4-dicarboxylate transport system permease small subunit
MPVLSKLNAFLIGLAEWLTIVSLGAIAVVVPWEVFNRYLLNEMATWSTEFNQYCLVCASMMGAAAGLKKGYQVGITSLIESLGPAAARGLQGIIFGLVIVFCGVMAWFGAVQTIENWEQTSSSMGISMSIPYASLPLGFATMILVTLEQLVDLCSGRVPVSGDAGA